MLFLALFLFFISVFLLVIQLWPEKLEVSEEEKVGGLYRLFRPFIKYLANLNRKLPLAGMKKSYLRKIERAGLQIELSPDDFLAIKELTLIGFFLFSLLFYSVLGKAILVIIFGILLGYFLPDIRLSDRIKKRELAIIRAMPNFLDFLSLAVEAGLDFAGAVRKVVEKSRPNPLISEFKLFLRELIVGKTRKEALRGMAQKLDMTEINSFTSTIIQAEEAGSSLGQVLKIQADELRTKRFQRAEKLASQAPIKMLFPLIAFIFPATFIMLFGSSLS